MNKSESIQNLAKALTAFQREVKNPANTAINPHFKSKYAPLNEILNEVRPILAKNGLSVIQSPSGDGDKVIITTLLMHESGEWIEACPLVLKTDRPTAQGAGSAITYGRRYSLAAVLGISSEDDDDGNGAEVKHPPHNKAQSKPQQPPKQTSQAQQPQNKNGDLISDAQRKKIYAMTNNLGIAPDVVKKIMSQRYKVDDSKQLTKKQASDFIEYLTKMENGEEVWFDEGEVSF